MDIKHLIVMLTWNDVTVENAKEIFLEAKNAKATHWGFKVEGTTPESMRELILLMKEAGKKTYIEELAIDESTCVKSAKDCARCGVDHLLGTMYYDSVKNICDDAGIAYSPFVALDADTRLRAPIDEIIRKAKEAEEKGIWGINLSAFRYLGGDPVDLLKHLSNNISKQFTIAGSINSYERIDFLKNIPKLYGFTIGGAFFEHKFGDTFAGQINAVCDYLKCNNTYNADLSCHPAGEESNGALSA